MCIREHKGFFFFCFRFHKILFALYEQCLERSSSNIRELWKREEENVACNITAIWKIWKPLESFWKFNCKLLKKYHFCWKSRIVFTIHSLLDYNDKVRSIMLYYVLCEVQNAYEITQNFVLSFKYAALLGKPSFISRISYL